MNRLLETSQLFPALSIDLFADANQFVTSWKPLYNYPGYDRFAELVQNQELTAPELEELFLWKNNMSFSGNKRARFEKIVAHLDDINALKVQFDVHRFDQLFGEVSAIWQIFLL